MQTLRWGIIGVGRFGLIHGHALRSLPGCELAAVANRNQERLAQAADELEVEAAYADYRQLLDDPRVDVVTIATHWRDHCDVALDALASGKHVFLEKPMAADGEECRRILAALELATGKFMVGHICRFDPRAALAKEAIDAGRLGRVFALSARRNLPLAPGEVRGDKIPPLTGDGIHDADLMMWFLGRAPSRVYAKNLRVENFTYPDAGWAMLEFGDDAVGVIETNWRLPSGAPTTIDANLRVVGTEGQLTIDCAHTGLTIQDPGGISMPDTVYWPRQHHRVVGALCHELAYFADCIRHDQQPQVVTAEEAARAVRVMELAERSAETGGPLELDS